MEYQRIVLMIVAILVIAAVYIAITTVKPVVPVVDTKPAEELLLRGIMFGKGEKNYVYAYNEISDGYQIEYVVKKNGENGSVTLENPLSIKNAYFLANDTILCIKYPITNNDSCASVKGKTELKNYMDSVSTKFLNDNLMELSKNNIVYLISKDYLKLDPLIIPKDINGTECLEIRYNIDYSNISLDDAARFKMGSDAPKKFNWKMCIRNQTGQIYQQYFDYETNGVLHTYTYQLLSFQKGGAVIELPQELDGDVLSRLSSEREQYAKLAKCYTDKQGNEREKCITSLAITLKRKELCVLTTERRDMCLVGIVPITKDVSICEMVTSPSYKDDCYIELAGSYKDASYCNMIQNTSKLAMCNTVAKPYQTDVCESIANAVSKDRCNTVLAAVRRNESYCNRILNESNLDGCVEGATANYTGNISNMDTEMIMAMVDSSLDIVKYFMDLAKNNGTINGTVPMPPGITNTTTSNSSIFINYIIDSMENDGNDNNETVDVPPSAS